MKQTTTKVYCDVCGEPFNEEQHHGLSQYTDRYIASIRVEYHDKTDVLSDVCIKCNQTLVNVLGMLRGGMR